MISIKRYNLDINKGRAVGYFHQKGAIIIRSIQKIAFVGSGMIGTGIAVNCMLHGYHVTLQTRSEVGRVHKEIGRILKLFQQEGVAAAEQCEAASGLYTVTTDIAEAVFDADLVQEAGPEDLALKCKLLGQIEADAPAGAYLTSTSSRHTCGDLKDGMLHPERFVCVHPWHPSYLLPLVEIMGSDRTSPETVAAVKAFFDGIGKETVICRKDISGYVSNEISWAIMRIAKQYVANGVCSAEDMDRALMFGPGLRLAVTGQLLTIDLGTQGGLKNYAAKYNREPEPDIAVITDSIAEEMNCRPETEGRDWDSISAYRDKMIIRFLREKEVVRTGREKGEKK